MCATGWQIKSLAFHNSNQKHRVLFSTTVDIFFTAIFFACSKRFVIAIFRESVWRIQFQFQFSLSTHFQRMFLIRPNYNSNHTCRRRRGGGFIPRTEFFEKLPLPRLPYACIVIIVWDTKNNLLSFSDHRIEQKQFKNILIFFAKPSLVRHLRRMQKALLMVIYPSTYKRTVSINYNLSILISAIELTGERTESNVSMSL